MAFVKVDTPPQDSELAIRSPRGWMHHYEDPMNRHHQYWHRIALGSEVAVDLARHAMSHDLHQVLHDAGLELTELIQGNTNVDPRKINAHAAERTRRLGLGGLAMSLLLRGGLLKVSGEIVDGAALGTATLLQDLSADNTGMPREYRLHLPYAMATNPQLFPVSESMDQWYRDGVLWVHRTAIADPSTEIKRNLQKRGIAVDYTQLTTLYPYVASAIDMAA